MATTPTAKNVFDLLTGSTQTRFTTIVALAKPLDIDNPTMGEFVKAVIAVAALLGVTTLAVRTLIKSSKDVIWIAGFVTGAIQARKK